MKTLVIDPLSPSTVEELSKNVDLYYMPNSTIEEIEKELDNTSVIIMRSAHVLTNSMVDKATNLKAVIRAGNGTENIPVNLLKERGIFFTNLKNISSSAVAEYAVGLIILGMRNIVLALESIKEKKWSKSSLIGNEIRGKTLGLIGFGNIGKEIAKLMEPFGVTIIYNNNSGPLDNVKYKYVSKETLFLESDIISIQIPLSDSSYKLINEHTLNLMKSSSVLINLSRYDVIDMDSLELIVKQNKIKSVFIDPFEKKYFSDIDKFEKYPVYFLPHIGANTFESQDKIGVELLKLLKKIKNEEY